MTNIKEVAKQAGVSPSTVSRVINNHPYVNIEKKNKVLQVIEKLNYIPNINAIHLKKGITNLIGVVIPFSNHPYFSQLIQGISEEAIKINKKIVLFQTSYDKDQEIDALEMLKLKQLDALIICSRNISIEIIEPYLKYGPISLFENIDDSTFHTSYIDHYASFKKSLYHLYEQGHRQIGCVVNRKNSSSSIQRISAYKDFCIEKNIDLNDKNIFDGYVLLEDGNKLSQVITKLDTPPTALLISGDYIAAGFYLSLTETQRQQISIIGFEDQEISKLLNITTVKVPLKEIGKSLFKQLDNKQVTNYLFNTQLIIRNSVHKISN